MTQLLTNIALFLIVKLQYMHVGQFVFCIECFLQLVYICKNISSLQSKLATPSLKTTALEYCLK